MKKILLITGATGFTGRYLVEEALKHDYMPVVFARPTSDTLAFEKNGIEVFKHEAGDISQVISALKTVKEKYGIPQLIIHNAGAVKAYEKEVYFEVNTSNTATFIDAIKESDMLPQMFIYTSSIAALGPGDPQSMKPIDENKKARPVTYYGKSKLAAEKLIRNDHKLPWVIIRPTAVYGAGDTDGLLLYKSIKSGFELYPASKKQRLSFIHAADLARAYFLIAEKSPLREVYNLSDGKNYDAAEFNAFLREALGKKTFKAVVPLLLLKLAAAFNSFKNKRKHRLTIFTFDKVNELKAPNWAVDNAKLSALGFEASRDLRTEVREIAKWYEDNGWL